MARKILNKNSPGTSTTWGSDDWDYINKYLGGGTPATDVDQSATDPVSIKTNTSFWDNRLRFWNPAKTFSYRLRTLAILANYDITLPLITSNDEFEMLLAAQTPQNKTINLANNILTSTGASAGGIPSHNGTKYVNKALGSAGQVPVVNVGGTDWAWGTNTASDVADNSVSTVKIQNSAVTNDKLAGSIQGTKLLDNSITDAKLQAITDKAKLPSDVNYNDPSDIHTGWLNPKHATEHGGMLNGICVAASGQTFSANSSNSGSQGRFTTGSSSGNQGGFRTNVSIGERNHDTFLFECRYVIDNAALVRGFIGFVDDISAFRSGADMLNAKSGIGIGWDAGTSANWKVAHNDGAGATVFDDWSTPTAIDATTHTFTILANNAATRFEAYIDGQAVKNLTTDIPAQNTELAFQCYIETATGATRRMDVKFLVIKDSVP